jgi:hypothetical protein
MNVMAIIKITPENMNDFPVGTVVLSRYGAYYPELEGVVVGYDLQPATKYFPASASLVVRRDDGTSQNVSQLYPLGTRVGPIGTYLIKIAERVANKSRSPWASDE